MSCVSSCVTLHIHYPNTRTKIAKGRVYFYSFLFENFNWKSVFILLVNTDALNNDKVYKCEFRVAQPSDKRRTLSPVTPGNFATWPRSVAHGAPQSLFYRTHGRPSLRGRLRPGSDGPAQWHTARRRAYLPHARTPVSSGDVCDQVPMARSRSSNHGAELTSRRWKKLWYFAIFTELFVKIRFLCGKSDFLGLSVWFFVSRGWHLWSSLKNQALIRVRI